jgi:hypothetical protein
MDWALAIRLNRSALLGVVAAIVALLDRAGEGRVTRRLRKAALALLRPAEAATRRLIVIAARGLTAASRPRPIIAFGPGGAGRGREGDALLRPAAFRLFDPPKRFAFKRWVPPPAGVPRIRTFWPAPAQPVAIAPPPAQPVGPRAPVDPDAPVDAARLRLRLAALERALTDLPRQARRLARWRAREAAPRNAVLPRHRPLRLGSPPGWRRRPTREVDRVLRECHALAHDALRHDTS